jgi:small conductance mechanosensitive channel
MPVNFQILEASLVLYGLNALYATVLLIVGWYLAGLAQGFVFRR